MKTFTKTLAVFAAVTATMASCSSEEELETNTGNEIEFRAALGHGTRAAETTIANLQKFWVTAIGSDGSTYYTDDYTRVESTWIPSDRQHYWPVNNSELRFYAYSPAATSLTGTFTITGSEQTVAGFSPAAALADQQDFIVAFGSGRKSAQGATGVQLTFRHVLSQIEIRAKNAGAIYTYKVTGVRIGSVVSSADLTLPSSADGHGSWTLGSDRTDYIVEYETSPLTLGSEAVSLMPAESGTAMLIPQQLTAWDVAADKTNTAKGSFLAVKINIVAQADGNQLYPAADGAYGWACIPVGTNWQPGYKYIYTLDFSNGAGKLPPEDPDVPGDDILTDPIRFTVDVQLWVKDDGNYDLNM